jgi:hypothetical protein
VAKTKTSATAQRSRNEEEEKWVRAMTLPLG